jgi:hypothetical protein
MTGPPPPSPRAWQTRQARQSIQPPAICLIVLGSLGLALQLALLALGVLGAGAGLSQLTTAPLGSTGEQAIGAMVGLGATVVLRLFALIVSAVIILGGIRMNNLRSWGLSLASAILAMVPCASPCCCLGLPLGIWALVVLADEGNRTCFHS